MKNIEPISFMIICLLYIVAGGYCAVLPKQTRQWLNKRSQIELRILGVLIFLAGALLIMQLLAFSAMFKAFITITEAVK